MNKRQYKKYKNKEFVRNLLSLTEKLFPITPLPVAMIKWVNSQKERIRTKEWEYQRQKEWEQTMQCLTPGNKDDII